jgi:hypothetical protein
MLFKIEFYPKIHYFSIFSTNGLYLLTFLRNFNFGLTFIKFLLLTNKLHSKFKFILVFF